MKFLIIDNGTTMMDRFAYYFSAEEYDVIQKESIENLNTDLYYAIILTGSLKHGVVEDTHLFEEEAKLVKETKLPVLGICLGFELMIHSYGGELIDLPKRIRKIESLKYIKDPIFESIDELVVSEAHRWLIKYLPPDFIPLAYSDTGVEVIKHVNKFMYGVQFHPESRLPKTNGYKIMQNFLKMAKINTQR